MSATLTDDNGTNAGAIVLPATEPERSARSVGSRSGTPFLPSGSEVRGPGYRSTIQRDREAASGALPWTPDRSRSRATIAAGHERTWLHAALAYLSTRSTAAPSGVRPARFRV